MVDIKSEELTMSHIFDQLKKDEGRNIYIYKFYIKPCCRLSFWKKWNRNVISGEYRDHGKSWVRVRESSAYREHNDVLIPLDSIRLITEYYTAE